MARLLVEKFVLGRPTHRIAAALAHDGLELADGTLAGVLAACSDLVAPLAEAIGERNAAAAHLHVDETRWQVYAAVEGKHSHRWWCWVFAGPDTTVFTIAPSRSLKVLVEQTRATFDDPNLVSHAGLVPAVRLVENVGLEDLVGEHVRVAAKVGANPGLKVGSLVAGMVAGADSIDGMDLLRHGAIPATVGGIRAPSTLGSFLRAFDHGNVRQLAAVHRRVLTELAAQTPLLPGADALAFIDVDSVQRRVFGGTKQGAAFGHAKIASRRVG